MILYFGYYHSFAIVDFLLFIFLFSHFNALQLVDMKLGAMASEQNTRERKKRRKKQSHTEHIGVYRVLCECVFCVERVCKQSQVRNRNLEFQRRWLRFTHTWPTTAAAVVVTAAAIAATATATTTATTTINKYRKKKKKKQRQNEIY